MAFIYNEEIEQFIVGHDSGCFSTDIEIQKFREKFIYKYSHDVEDNLRQVNAIISIESKKRKIDKNEWFIEDGKKKYFPAKPTYPIHQSFNYFEKFKSICEFIREMKDFVRFIECDSVAPLPQIFIRDNDLNFRAFVSDIYEITFSAKWDIKNE